MKRQTRRPASAGARRKVLALAKALDLAIDEYPGEILVTAPKGHHFEGHDVHEFVACYGPESWDPWSLKRDAWADLAGRITGVVPCSIEERCDGFEQDGGCGFWRNDEEDAR